MAALVPVPPKGNTLQQPSVVDSLPGCREYLDPKTTLRIVMEAGQSVRPNHVALLPKKGMAVQLQAFFKLKEHYDFSPGAPIAALADRLNNSVVLKSDGL